MKCGGGKELQTQRVTGEVKMQQMGEVQEKGER